MAKDDSNVQPERENPNGKDNPGADPNQQDKPVDRPNGDKGPDKR